MSLPLPFLSNEQLLEVFNLTKTATAIHITEDAIIQSANDAMLRIWDKDRSIIGKTLEDALPELKGQPFIEMFKRVWNEGLTLSGTDTAADLIVDGVLQTFYFDFEYRAIKDAEGKTICIMHTAIDITERHLNRDRLEKAREKEEALHREKELNEQLAAANEELSALNEEYQITLEKLNILNTELEDRVYRRTQALADGMEREQTMNEELLASNEELIAVNEQLSVTITEMNRLQVSLQLTNKELLYSEQKLDDILNQQPSPVVVLRGPDQVIEFTNQALLSFWNKEEEEVIGKPILQVFPELKNQPYPEQWKHVLETGESITNKEKPVIFHKANGPRLYYVDYYYQPLMDLDGVRTGVLVTVIDVTHKVDTRKQLEQNQLSLQDLNNELSTINEEMTASNEELMATNEELAIAQGNLLRYIGELAESEARFRSLVEQAPVAINIFQGRELIIDIANEKMFEIWGKTKEVLGNPLAEVMPELDGQPFLQILDDVITSGHTFYGNEVKAYIERQGELVESYLNLIYQPIRDKDGAVTGIMQVANEITEQVKIKHELQKTEEMMRLAIDAAKLGAWHLDPVTKSLKYNPMLAKLIGYEEEEPLTYEKSLTHITDDYRQIISEEIEKAISNGGDYDMTYSQHRFNDGELIWLRSLGKISKDEHGEHTLFSGFMMDITEMKKDEQRKNDFIGMVSHELKTPLTSLSGYIQILQSKARKNEDSFASNALSVAEKQIRKMTSMINGFLNISRLESGKITLNKTSFRLDELVIVTAEEISSLESSHQINFAVNEPIEVFADPDKISNVISNLLSNAIKYAPNDKDIDLRCEIIDGMAQISIKDRGMGIGQEDLQKLFERFYRVENNSTISGFGIGLYLSAEIIQRHAGKIWVESELGKGSTFYFSIPLPN